ncbi:hypothetical protein OHB30_42810 [Streptomyces europaeiscabiei]|nr:hypothetical protein OHB30_42810 [Streptomyces europaeiscabiei]
MPTVNAPGVRSPVVPAQLGAAGLDHVLPSGVSSVTFYYLHAFLWKRVWYWLRRKHPRATWKELRRRYCGGGWWPSGQKAVLFDPEKVTTQWYRFRGAKIPSPWPITG